MASGIKILQKCLGHERLMAIGAREQEERPTFVRLFGWKFHSTIFFLLADRMMHRFLLFDVDNLWATVVAEQNHIYSKIGDMVFC
jgi:hypothetical protein